jgi:hypothetical protein
MIAVVCQCVVTISQSKEKEHVWCSRRICVERRLSLSVLVAIGVRRRCNGETENSQYITYVILAIRYPLSATDTADQPTF